MWPIHDSSTDVWLSAASLGQRSLARLACHLEVSNWSLLLDIGIALCGLLVYSPGLQGEECCLKGLRATRGTADKQGGLPGWWWGALASLLLALQMCVHSFPAARYKPGSFPATCCFLVSSMLEKTDNSKAEKRMSTCDIDDCNMIRHRAQHHLKRRQGSKAGQIAATSFLVFWSSWYSTWLLMPNSRLFGCD